MANKSFSAKCFLQRHGIVSDKISACHCHPRHMYSGGVKCKALHTHCQNSEWHVARFQNKMLQISALTNAFNHTINSAPSRSIMKLDKLNILGCLDFRSKRQNWDPTCASTLVCTRKDPASPATATGVPKRQSSNAEIVQDPGIFKMFKIPTVKLSTFQHLLPSVFLKTVKK